MAPLPSNLRRDLERAIIRAREIAVAGSRSALEALTVHEGKRGPHITSEKQSRYVTTSGRTQNRSATGAAQQWALGDRPACPGMCL